MDRRILIAGASGYVGGRLLRALEDAGQTVRCVARHPASVTARHATTEVVQGDCLDEPSLDRAFAGVRAA